MKYFSLESCVKGYQKASGLSKTNKQVKTYREALSACEEIVRVTVEEPLSRK